MYQLFIHENPQSPKAKYYATDASGNLKFLIEGKTNRIRDTIRIRDLNGEEIFKAKQRVISPYPKFDIFCDSDEVATFQKHPNLFNGRAPYYTLSPQGYKLTGDYKAERYEMRDVRGHIVLHIQKCMTSRGYQFILLMDYEESAAIFALIALLVEHFSRTNLKNFLLNKDKQDLDFGLMNFDIENNPCTKK